MSDEYLVHNVSEDLVDMYLDQCIRASDMCGCARCRADVRAVALNNFPPHYAVTDIGDVLIRVNSLSNQFQADIITAIMTAVRIVRDKPRHKQDTQK